MYSHCFRICCFSLLLFWLGFLVLSPFSFYVIFIFLGWCLPSLFAFWRFDGWILLKCIKGKRMDKKHHFSRLFGVLHVWWTAKAQQRRKTQTNKKNNTFSRSCVLEVWWAKPSKYHMSGFIFQLACFGWPNQALLNYSDLLSGFRPNWSY